MKIIFTAIVALVSLSLSAQEFYQFDLEYNASNISSNTYAVGNFNLDWNSDNGQLSITHTDNSTKVLWQTNANVGFVGGAIGEADIEDNRGSFIVEDHKISVLETQSIENVNLSGDTFLVCGNVFNDSIEANYCLKFYEVSLNQLEFSLSIEAPINRAYLTYSMADEIGIFGFGAQCTYFNHKGNRVPILVQEQGVGRGDVNNVLVDIALGSAQGNDYTAYISVPQYITSNSNGLFLENYEISNFDFTEEDQAQIELYGNELKGRILNGATPLKILEEYTAYAGRMKKLPDWVIEGAIIGMQGGTSKLYNIWNQLKIEETPLSAFWIQDWVGQRTSLVGKQLWWNWELDNNRYPDYDLLLDSLGNYGIELMGYVNPFLVNVYQQKPYRRNQFQEGNDNGYLVTRENGFPYLIPNTSFSSAIIDISNPETRIWIKDIIKDEIIARGFKGWMADFGEALPFDAILDSEDPATYHNEYAEDWARLNKEAVEEVGLEDEIVFFSRSGYTRSPGESTLFWLGDQLVDWGENDGIKSAVTGLLSSGMSGFSYMHTDIGGYTSFNVGIGPVITRSRELLERWTEMNAFTVVFRTHEGLGPTSNHQIYEDEASIQHFAKWAKVFNALLFYRKQLVEEASLTGNPVVRPPFLHYPGDVNVLDLTYQQFMFGDQFMVAPVTEVGATSTDIYLPEGDWVNLWNGDEVNSSGQTYTINDIPDRPAVFYVKGSTVAAQFIQNMIDAGIYE
ncbi:MAG: alpha-glucosidase [Chitinophagales bacterium]